MNGDVMRLPATSFDMVKRIVHGYYRLGSDATLDQIATRIDVSRDTITRTNPFLVDVGLISGGMKKSCTELCTQLGSAIENGLEDDVIECITKILSENAFFSEVISDLKVKKEVKKDIFIGNVIKLSKKKRSKTSIAGANCVVDMLIAAGKIKENEGNLIPVYESEISQKAEVPIGNCGNAVSKGVQYQVKQTLSPSVVINIQIELPKFEDATKYELIFAAMKKHLFSEDA